MSSLSINVTLSVGRFGPHHVAQVHEHVQVHTHTHALKPCDLITPNIKYPPPTCTICACDQTIPQTQMYRPIFTCEDTPDITWKESS